MIMCPCLLVCVFDGPLFLPVLPRFVLSCFVLFCLGVCLFVCLSVCSSFFVVFIFVVVSMSGCVCACVVLSCCFVSRPVFVCFNVRLFVLCF